MFLDEEEKFERFPNQSKERDRLLSFHHPIKDVLADEKRTF